MRRVGAGKLHGDVITWLPQRSGFGSAKAPSLGRPQPPAKSCLNFDVQPSQKLPLSTSTNTVFYFLQSQIRKMPRRSGGGGRAPSRPTVSRPAPPPPTKQQQSRPNATYAAPTQQAGQKAQGAQAGQTQGPGLFGQMASTAA
jgi:hypothetical protein